MNHNQPEHPPRRERDPHGWDLPISLTDADALGRRIEDAADNDTIIGSQDAQTIALCLSDRLGSGLHSAIRQLAEIGSINAPALRAECLDARTHGDLTPGLQRWAAWLVTYAAHALPPATGGLQIPSNGDALDAYLRLPDIDATVTGDSTLEEFGHAYCGTYADIDAVLDGVTEVLEWERKIHALAGDLGCEEFVSIDRDGIARQMREGWDIIPGRGGLHVFFR